MTPNLIAGIDPAIFPLVSQYSPIKSAMKFSVLICYEDIFPELVRERCQKGADFLVNISDTAGAALSCLLD
mgnify:CR=1 FL=1